MSGAQHLPDGRSLKILNTAQASDGDTAALHILSLDLENS
jgi:hypothetical protein